MAEKPIGDDVWVDEGGAQRRVPTSRLVFKCPAHAALRAFVCRRDNFTCQKCGWRPSDSEIPGDYSGRQAVYGSRSNPSPKAKRRRLWPLILCGLDIDHKFPKARGGTNHPGNLQVMCAPCNSGKCDKVQVAA